jgi:hypothetical protein
MYHVHPGQGLVITILVMTFTKVSAKDHGPVSPLVEGLEDQFRMYHSGTHHPDDPNIGRVLHSRGTCQVCSGIRTPVAAESDYFWFKTHSIFSLE